MRCCSDGELLASSGRQLDHAVTGCAGRVRCFVCSRMQFNHSDGQLNRGEGHLECLGK